jgi:hypothetical protein
MGASSTSSCMPTSGWAGPRTRSPCSHSSRPPRSGSASVPSWRNRSVEARRRWPSASSWPHSGGARGPGALRGPGRPARRRGAHPRPHRIAGRAVARGAAHFASALAGTEVGATLAVELWALLLAQHPVDAEGGRSTPRRSAMPAARMPRSALPPSDTSSPARRPSPRQSRCSRWPVARSARR